ncbi:hypothetical protein HDU80_010563 [Chytriomyces hyalinus]|nr:hypothetical protein HDU80_010563 [Chytriomyces hyalinus]
MMVPLLALLCSLMAYAQSTQSQTSSYCDKSGAFCVSVAGVSNGEALVTVQSSATGWAAVAFGATGMSGNSPAYVGWAGETNTSIQISQRALVSPMMPAFTAAVALVPTPAWATSDFPVAASAAKNLLFSFRVPASLVTGATFNCVYAFSNAGPLIRNTPNSTFPKHNQAGQFKLSAASNSTSSSTGTAAIATGSQSSAKYCIDVPVTSCIVIVRDSLTKLANVTVYSSLKGWAAVGTGSAMAGSTVFVGWRNDGKSIISQRSSSGYSLPSAVASEKTTFIPIDTPASIQIPSTANTFFSFQVPEFMNFVQTSGSSNFIFAGSDAAPSNKSNSASDFTIHSFKTAFSLDLSQLGAASTGVSAAANPSRATLILAHGILMFVGFAVLMPLAIFIARYMKLRWSSSWFYIHVLLMTVGSGGLMIAGLVCVEWTLGLDSSAFVRNGAHGILGAAIIFGLYPVQVLLGVVCNTLYNNQRTSVPWWDRLHHWIGRLIGLAAIVNMYLGINVWSNGSLGYAVGYWVWIGFVVLVLFGIVGELLMVGRHRGVQFNEDGSTVGIGRQTTTLPVPSVVGTSGHWFHETRLALSRSSGSPSSSVGAGSGLVSSSQQRLHNYVQGQQMRESPQQEPDETRGHFTDDGVFKLPAKKVHKYQI